MYLSKLQKYIILECYLKSGKIDSLESLTKFYKTEIPVNAKKIITNSLKKMVKKGIVSILARKTPHKLFIKEVKLTNFGKKIAKKILKEKQKLPLKIEKKGRKTFKI